jgi:hypothetical protein
MNTKKKTDEIAILAAVLAILALLAVGVFAQSGATFRFFGPLSRIVTPNGDGKNDLAIFCFDNPADSGVSGKIYTLLGSEVSTVLFTDSPANVGMPGCNQPGALVNSVQFATWDGRSNGSVVRSGIYVYRLTAEQHNYTGTLIVVR